MNSIPREQVVMGDGIGSQTEVGPVVVCPWVVRL